MAARIKMPIRVEVGLGPGDFVRWGPHYPAQKGGGVPNCRPMLIVAKRLDASRWALGVEVGLSPGDFVLDGDPALPSQN